MTIVASSAKATVTPLAPPADERSQRWRWLLPLLLAALPILLVLYVLLGSGGFLDPATVWRVLTGQPDVTRLEQIAVAVRLPRGVFALLAGASLATAGALLQSFTRNPLASPELTGVTQGAVAGAVVWITFGPSLPAAQAAWVVAIVATLAGLASAIVVYLLVRGYGSVESTRLLLIGILIGGILMSVTLLSLLFLGTEAAKIYEWLSGSLLGITWGEVSATGAFLSVGAVFVVLAVPRANALQLGADVALAVGQRRELDRVIVLVTAVWLTAGTVAMAGALGFVGLIAPHIVRPLVGNDLRRLVPAAALVGSGMVLLADMLARNFDPAVITGTFAGDSLQGGPLPVGVYLTLLGIPFLIALVWRGSR